MKWEVSFHFVATLYFKMAMDNNFTVMYFSFPVMKGNQQVFSKLYFAIIAWLFKLDS